MTTDTQREVYDPEAAPEESPRRSYVEFTASEYVADAAAAEALGERVARSWNSYFKNGGEAPCWYLEATTEDATFEDGNPLTRSDLIKLYTKDGRPLDNKQAPAILANRFKELGVSASYTTKDRPDHIIGKHLLVESHEIKLGSFSKKVQLWPVEVCDGPFDGEVRIVRPRNADGVATTGAASVAAISHEEVARLLQRAFLGKAPSDMFDIIMDTPELKSVSSFYGQPLMEAANDESLAKILSDEGILTLVDGKFAIPSA